MKKAVMYGAGNIGRGFIGQLLSLSGYEVVFLDINDAVIHCMNERHCYPLRLVGDGGDIETVVRGVRGVNSMDASAAAEEIASADVMATAVGANVLPRIAPVIARGLRIRWQKGNAGPLNILICENLLHANRVLEELLQQHLDIGLHQLLRERVGLVEASVGRMVPVATAAMQQGDILRVWAEPYAELPVDLPGFRGPVPEITGLKPFTPFEFHIERKLYMHNMSHAMLAYLGAMAGHEFIWQAVRDSEIAGEARAALAESAEALHRKHGVPLEELELFSEGLMHRFDNPPLGDTIVRVGRDPMRKLAPGDRLVGAAETCVRQGVRPDHICRGIAAGLLFVAEGDDSASRIRKSIAELGFAGTLRQYCGIGPDNLLYPLVLRHYDELASVGS